MAKLGQVKVGLIGAMAWAVVILTLWGTTPTGIKPIGVTLWFLVLWVALASGIALLLDTIKRVFGPKKPEGRKFQPSLRQGILIGSWLTIVIALSSLRQLSLRDLILTCLLIIIIEFYMRLRQ